MIDDKQRVLMLSHALGLAIGALETINTTPYDFNKDGLVAVLNKLKAITEPGIFYVSEPISAAPNKSE